jgi:hypothetical protein
MSDNILRGKIIIDAPGVQQTAVAVVSSVDKMQAAFKRSVPGVNQAGQSIVNLGRVLQDAPFGFIGIANNLNPLLESFQRLSKEAGGAKGAFKALASSLLGTGGLGLALSAFQFHALGGTAALEGFIKKLLGTETVAERVKKSIDAVLVDAAKNAGEKAAQLEIFRNKLNDLNLSATQRTKIAKEYNEIADKANQIDTRQIGNLQSINEKLTQQNSLILQRAVSLAATTQLGEFAGAFVEQQLKVSVALNQLGTDEATYIQKAGNFATERNAIISKIASTGSITEPGQSKFALTQKQIALDSQIIKELGDNTFSLLGTIKARDEARKALDAATNGLSKLITPEGLSKNNTASVKSESSQTEFLFEFFPFDVNGKLKPEQKAKLVDAANKFSKEFGSILKGVDFNIGATSNDDVIKNAKKFWDDFKKGLIEFKPPEIDIPAGINIIPQVSDFDPTQINKFINALTSKATNTEGIDAVSLAVGEKAFEKSEKEFAKMQKRMENLASTVTDTLAPAFTDMFSAILQGEQPLKAFFDGLGQSVVQLIQKIITAAIEAAILNALLPGGLGKGADAIKGFGNLFRHILGFNRGGIVPGSGSSDTVPAMLTPGELVVPKEKASKVAAYLKSLDGGAVLSFQSNLARLFDFKTPTTSLPDFNTKLPIGSFSGISPNSVQPQYIMLSPKLRGKDIVLQGARTLKSQNR